MEKEIFVCNCGREFKSRRSLNSHARFCNKYIKKKQRSIYYNEELKNYTCECGKIFVNSQSLNAHFSHCETHAEKNGKELKNRDFIVKGKMCGWDNKTPEEINLIHEKSAETIKKLKEEGKYNSPNKGKRTPENVKDKIRLGTLRYLKQNPNFNGPRYNKKACKYIDILNEQNNWNLKHALNGGEKEIFGFWVDGYDEELNIVFEYDERKHYKDIDNNILIDKDFIRQEKIIEKLNCEFYRYNEKTDYFYKVN
ncbi:MAG: hypothetical protein RSE41_00110 [Clostridia bacterium]